MLLNYNDITLYIICVRGKVIRAFSRGECFYIIRSLRQLLNLMKFTQISTRDYFSCEYVLSRRILKCERVVSPFRQRCISIYVIPTHLLI